MALQATGLPSPALSQSFRRHALVLLALLLNIAVIVLLITISHHDHLLTNETPEYHFDNILPALGALFGLLVISITTAATGQLVTAYARRKIVWEGITFVSMSDFHALAVGKLPNGSLPMLSLGLVLLICKSLIPFAIVTSLTPTTIPWNYNMTMPSVELSTSSGVTPNIWCEFLPSSSSNSRYGMNCPIQTAYGDIYTAGLIAFDGNIPANLSWQGVTYPSSLLGISGATPELSSRYVGNVTNNSYRVIRPSDTLDTCVPVMTVDVYCQQSLNTGQYFEMSIFPVNMTTPQSIVEATLCDFNTTKCSQSQYATDIGNGVMIVFGDQDQDTGNTTLTFFDYEGTQGFLPAAIQCQISAQEDLLPVRITGGTAVSQYPLDWCPPRSPVSPHFLMNVTRMGQMAIVKMQGPDGRIHALDDIPDSPNKIPTLASAIQMMVATGATQMYSTAYANASQYQNQVSFLYGTTRKRLGLSHPRRFLLAFLPCPLLLVAFLLSAWLFAGFSTDADVHFNPLSPVCTAAAGMNRNALSMTLAAHSRADKDELEGLGLVLRFVYVTDDRMGLESIALATSVQGEQSLLLDD